LLLLFIINIRTSKLLLSGAKSDEELKRYIPDDSVRVIFWEEHEKLLHPAVSFSAVPLFPAVLPAGVTAHSTFNCYAVLLLFFIQCFVCVS
jgi:hypothetical protein